MAQNQDVPPVIEDLNGDLWQSAVNAGLSDSEVGKLEDNVTVLSRVTRVWNTQDFSPDVVSVIEAAACKLDSYSNRSILAPASHPNNPDAVRVAQGIEKVFGEEADQMDPLERADLEEVLDAYDLAHSKARKLREFCNFREIIIQGSFTMSLKELSDFIDRHPGHHLAIFSMTRTEGMLCLYVPDLVRFLRRAVTPHRKSELTDEQLASFSMEDWQKFKVTNNGMTFSGEEIMMALEWYRAYLRLDELFRLLTSQQREIIVKYADNIRPAKSKSMVAGFFSRAARSVKRKLDCIWRLLSAKVLVDLIAALACTCVLAYALGSVVAAGAVAVAAQDFWPAIKSFMLGSVVQQIYTLFEDITTGGQTSWFGFIVSSITGALKLITPAWVYMVFESCKQLFDSGNESSANAAILGGIGAVSVLSSKAVAANSVAPGFGSNLGVVGAGVLATGVVAGVAAGTGVLATGTGSLVAGVGAVAAGAAAAGSSALAAGAGALAAGAGAITTGSVLAAGSSALAAGSGALAAGTGALAAGASALAAGASTVTTAGVLAAGSGALAAGATAVSAGAASALAAGTGALAAGTGALAAGAASATAAGSALVAGGTAALATGTGALAAGAASATAAGSALVAGGTAALAAGAASAASAVGAIGSAATAASAGVLGVGAGITSTVGAVGSAGLAAGSTVASGVGLVGSSALAVGSGVVSGVSAAGAGVLSGVATVGSGVATGVGALASATGTVVGGVASGVGTLASVSGTVLGAVASSAIPIAAAVVIGAIFMRWLSSRTNSQGTLSSLEVIGEQAKSMSSGLSSLLKMLAEANPCNLVESVLGPTSARVCRAVSRGAVVVLGFTMDLMRAIVDLLVLLVRATYKPDFVKGYKINSKFASVFASLNLSPAA